MGCGIKWSIDKGSPFFVAVSQDSTSIFVMLPPKAVLYNKVDLPNHGPDLPGCRPKYKGH